MRITADLSSLIRGIRTVDKNQHQLGSNFPKPGSQLASIFARSPLADSSIAVGDQDADVDHSRATDRDVAVGEGDKLFSPTQLELRSIRELLATAIDAGADDSAVFDAVLAQLSELTGAAISVGGTETAQLSGINRRQIDRVDVVRVDAGASLNIVGEVSSAAQSATLTLTGGADGAVNANAALKVTGNRGTRQFHVTAGEALDDVADAVNAASATTGVEAIVVGDNIQLTSLTRGSNARVEFELTTLQTGGQDQQITGVNSSQIAAFTAVQSGSGHDVVLSGQFTAAAAAAEIRYVGGAGATVAGTATFDVVGNAGAASFAITAGEALSAAADRINAQTGATGVAATVDGNELVLTSNTTGDDASVAVQNIVSESIVTVSGVDAAQFSGVEVDAIAPNTTRTITGSIDSQASAAELIYQGAGGVVVNDATFQLQGGVGTATISITGGESLDDVAARINDETVNTAVTATVSGDQLIFASTDVGAAANISVTLIDVESIVTVDGVNEAQLASFVVNSVDDNSVQTLSGTIDSTATAAELTYTGLIGRANPAATFTLTGPDGSAAISVEAFENLAIVRDEINAESENTGVTAFFSGNTLTLTTNAVGSAAAIEIDVHSGSFTTNGTGIGADATATVNGQSITAAGNDFTFADAAGSYSFTAQQGFTGAIDEVTVTAVDGAFDLSGGAVDPQSGDVTANGAEAAATLNGQSLTAAAGGVFTLTDGGDQFTLTVDATFTGAIDAITVSAADAAFDLVGGVAADQGSDATAVINGTMLSSEDRTFLFSDATGDYTFEFADGFVGAFDDVTVTATTESGRAVGREAEGTFNGVTQTAVDGRFIIGGDGVKVSLKPVDDFVGSLDPITITDGRTFAPSRPGGTGDFTDTQRHVLELALRSLAAAAGSDAGRAEALHAALQSVVTVEDVLLQSRTGASVFRPPSDAIAGRSPNTIDDFTRAAIVSQSFRALVEANPQYAADAFGRRDADLRSILDLLG